MSIRRGFLLSRSPRAPTASPWRKVTTLLDLFGAYRLTTDVRRRIADALSQANLIPKPPIEEVERFETVRLALDVDQDGRPDDPEDTRSRSISRLLPTDEVIVPTRRENGPRRADHHRSDQNDDAVPVLSRFEKNTDRQTDEGHER
jgi:hypothetical protein